MNTYIQECDCACHCHAKICNNSHDRYECMHCQPLQIPDKDGKIVKLITIAGLTKTVPQWHAFLEGSYKPGRPEWEKKLDGILNCESIFGNPLHNPTIGWTIAKCFVRDLLKEKDEEWRDKIEKMQKNKRILDLYWGDPTKSNIYAEGYMKALSDIKEF